MPDFSRRQFLKQLSFFATTLVLSPKILANNDSFEMLVVGDSFIWGQGLQEKDKFYTLVQNWLQNELKKEVRLNLKAHSGATIFLPELELTLLKNAGKDENQEIPREIPIAFPTIAKQIENAKNDYEKKENVNLVMLTGGIADIAVSKVLDPKAKDDELIQVTKKYCGEDMFKVLDEATQIFPNALFILVGYFPIISKYSKSSKVFNAYLEAMEIPRIFKPLINNPLGRQFLKTLKKRSIRRSQIWLENSNREFENVANRLNEKFGKQRVIFVKSPITEKEALHTDNTFLFEMGKKGRVNDAKFDERLKNCQETLPKLKKEIGYEESVRRCGIAAIGHPNEKGSKAYSDAIITKLKEIYKF
ncbi:MAG: hypothetical protein MUC29_12325 [Pyrinomonadaceae bacterium]|jgi:hypothetical protein|nr:hypothetical protein [Pyrinomonadaceae bacterium]